MTSNTRKKGFTLAEMAIVVLIGGIMLTMGLKMYIARLEDSAYSETKSKQDQIKIALIGFLRTNGRLPCPDMTASPTAPTGLETTPCTAPAVNGYGILPWKSLGLAQDIALDGWQNFFTYRVSNGPGTAVAAGGAVVPRAINNNQDWTLKSALGFDIRSLNTVTTGGFSTIKMEQGDGITPITAAASTITYNAVVVIYSHGKNGLSARTVKGPTSAAAVGADEVTNATAGSTLFIIRPYTDNTAPAGGGGAYDDVIVYMTPQDLLQPLMTEQTLKVITSYCPSACTGPNAPYPYCTNANVPASIIPLVACSASGVPYSFCTNPATPALPLTACINTNNPYNYCTGPGLPALPSTSNIPVGNPIIPNVCQ